MYLCAMLSAGQDFDRWGRRDGAVGVAVQQGAGGSVFIDISEGFGGRRADRPDWKRSRATSTTSRRTEDMKVAYYIQRKPRLRGDGTTRKFATTSSGGTVKDRASRFSE